MEPGAFTIAKQANFMKTLRHILCLILIATLMASGIPMYNSEDATMDLRVGLEDAVLRVQDFARSAETSAGFSESVARAVSTLNVVAGIKAVISEDKGSWVAPVHFKCCLISLSNISIASDGNEQVLDRPMGYETRVVSPAFRYG